MADRGEEGKWVAGKCSMEGVEEACSCLDLVRKRLGRPEAGKMADYLMQEKAV